MKDIPGFEGIYAATSCGRIWSYRNKLFLSPTLDKDGYERVCLTVNNQKYMRRVHRLVAAAFLPNPDDLPEINHKDKVRNHNWITNLEWCNRKYNCNYRIPQNEEEIL